MRKLRISFLRLCFLPLIVLAVFVRPSWTVESSAAFYIEFAGYLLLLAGLTIRIWCTFYIAGLKSKQLVTQGPYSISRNPLYIGTFLLAIGAGLCFENLLMLGFCGVIIVPVHAIVARREEAHLGARFGEQYQVYEKRVPRYWPRFSNYESPSSVMVSIRAIRRIAVDTVGVLLIPEIEDLLEMLHHEGVLPVLWHFP